MRQQDTQKNDVQGLESGDAIGQRSGRSVLVGSSQCALRLMIAVLVFFALLFALMRVAGVPVAHEQYYVDPGFPLQEPTHVERAWYALWTALKIHDFRPVAEFKNFGRFWAPVEAVPRVPVWLSPIHGVCVDLSYLVPPFACALLTYHVLARWYVHCRCGACGRVLRRLRTTVCPGCGAPL